MPSTELYSQQTDKTRYNLPLFPICVLYCFCAMVIGNGSIITSIAKVLLVLFTLFYIIRYPSNKLSRYNNSTYYKWNLIAAGYLISTILWTVSRSTTLSIASTYIFVVICNICLYYLITINNNYSTKILKYFILFAILMSIRGVLSFGALNVEERADMAAEGFNVNTLGMNCAIGGICAYYFYKTSSKNKIFYLLAAIFSLFIIILTGSKKAFLIPIIAFIIMKTCHSKKNFFVIIIGVIITMLIFYYMIMNISFLYNTIGFRFEGYINGMLGEGDVDASSKARIRFVEMGIEMFRQKMLTGYGLGTFRYLNFQLMGDDHYSHNNFIELLVSGGIVALVIYYWIYFLLIVKLIKYIKYTKNDLAITFLAILISFLFTHYGYVAYYSLTSNIILTIIAAKTFRWDAMLKLSSRCKNANS